MAPSNYKSQENGFESGRCKQLGLHSAESADFFLSMWTIGDAWLEGWVGLGAGLQHVGTNSRACQAS